MKKFFSLAVFCVTLVSLTGCGQAPDPSADDRMVVGTTIFPLYDIATQVAGEHAEVVLMLPPGASPHTFDPAPSVLRSVQYADALFTIGAGIDPWADRIADQLPNTQVVSLDDHVTLLETEEDHDEHKEEEHHDEETHEEHEEHGDHHDDDEHADHGHDDDHGHDHHGHHHGDVDGDPHYWLAPSNGAIIAQEMAEVLSQIDPEHATEYTDNAIAFVMELQNNTTQWQAAVDTLTNKELITFHDAFATFAHAFGLEVVATFEPTAGKTPTPAYLQSIQKEIEEHNLNVLFGEPQLDVTALAQFAQDNNLTIDTLDPIGGVEGRNSYIELLGYNVDTIVSALR